MSNFGDHPAGFFGQSEFYNGVTSSSLRANHGDSPGLKRTGVTGTSRRIFTHSSWVKRNGIFTQTESLLQVNQGNDSLMFGFRDTDDTDGPNIQLLHYNGSSYDFRVETSAKLRDVSSWYHIVGRVDTTQGTDSNRIRIYINGVLQTALAQNTYPSQNFDTNYNVNSSKMYVAGGAAANAGGGNVYFDSYITEINYVDGLSLGPDSFGETKNGVWIPINPVVSDYGNNGFRLQFQNSGTGTTGQGTTATTNIGDDSSGSGHNFSVLNYVTSDVVLDHPENNWCTINSVREDTLVNGSVTLSEGNLQSVDAGTTYSLHWTSTFEMSSGKWYWEVLAHTLGGDYANIGVCNAIHRGTTVGTGVFYGNDGKRNAASNTGGNTSYGATYADDDIIGVAFDADNESVTFYKNNSSQGAVGSVLTQANGGYFAGVGDGQNSTTYKYVANFGQDSSFAGNKTAQGNTDGNGNGDFYYAPPSGFVALCSANLPSQRTVL